MKKNNSHWIKRILPYIVILCLVMTSAGLDVQPAQARPLALMRTSLTVMLLAPLGTICLNQEYEVRGGIEFGLLVTSSKEGKSAKPSDKTVRSVQVDIKAEKGKVDPQRLIILLVGYNKIEDLSFKYKATKATEKETVTVKVAMDGLNGKDTWTFPVEKCKYNIHGSADYGAAVNAMASQNVWDFLGTYDVSGTVKVNEDGSITGQGVANLFDDAIFTGGLGEGTCEHTTPWQGNTTIDIEADPNAWANEGVLDLKFTIQPMQINATQIVCQDSESYGSAETPPGTIASFDLNFPGVPAEGGSTKLNFEFPSGQGELEMDLNVTPVEGGS
jgi:hypothetical protein